MRKHAIVALLLLPVCAEAQTPTKAPYIGWEMATPEPIVEEQGHHLRIVSGSFTLSDRIEENSVQFLIHQFVEDNSRCARDSRGACKGGYVSLTGAEAAAVLNQAFRGDNTRIDLVEFIFSTLASLGKVPPGFAIAAPTPTAAATPQE